MKICTLSSGSKGNAALVFQGGTYILIDQGITLKRLKLALLEFGITPDSLSAVFLTHEHSDHISGLPVLLNKYPDLPVYLSGGTFRAMRGKAETGNFNLIRTGDSMLIGEIEITSFETPHDTAESVGYTFFDGRRKLAYATDLGHISPTVRKAVMGADTVLLESNHDIDMLWMGRYTFPLKQRISGRYGHLSNTDGSEFAVELCGAGMSKLILAHLSEENNRPELALETAVTALGNAGFGTVSVEVAPARECGAVFEV